MEMSGEEVPFSVRIPFENYAYIVANAAIVWSVHLWTVTK